MSSTEMTEVSVKSPPDVLPSNLDEGLVQDGITNPAYDEAEQKLECKLFDPSVTYVEFMPNCLNASEQDETPQFEKLSQVIERANYWLQSNSESEIGVYPLKIETVEKKVQQNSKGINVDLDTSIHHEASHGNNSFIRGIRIWLVPKMDKSVPMPQIGQLTVFPDMIDKVTSTATDVMTALQSFYSSPNSTMPSFAPVSSTLDKLNRQLQMRPVPGRILNAETVTFKFCENFMKEAMDPDGCFWEEFPKVIKYNVFALRVYYIIGQPVFETIGYKDFAPDKIDPPGGVTIMARSKFGPFSKVLKRAASWLREQKNARLMNIQTVNVRHGDSDSLVKSASDGIKRFDPDICGYMESVHGDSQIVRVLRIFYLNAPKSESAVELYSSTELTSRLFIPERLGGTGKAYESYSKTVQRIIHWLQRSGNPVFNMETVNFSIHPDSYGSGVTQDKSDTFMNRSHGRYSVSAIRLYFSGPIKEAPTENEEPDNSWWAYAEACNIQ